WSSLRRKSWVGVRFPRSAATGSRNYPRPFRCAIGRSAIPDLIFSALPMFTGIIEETGEVIEIRDTGDFRTIHVRGKGVFDDLRLGSSIAVNGVCLTVRSIHADTFSAEMSRETLDRTSLGSLAKGAIVNLERPMRGDSRF